MLRMDSNTIQRVANKAHSLEKTTKKGRSSLLDIYNIPDTGTVFYLQGPRVKFLLWLLTV